MGRDTSAWAAEDWDTKLVADANPIVIVGNVGPGSVGKCGTLGAAGGVTLLGMEGTATISCCVTAGSLVGLGVGLHVGSVPGSTGGHHAFQVEYVLQYMNPGPQLP